MDIYATPVTTSRKNQAAGVVHSFLHGSVGNLDDEQKMADMATMVPHPLFFATVETLNSLGK